MEAILEPAVRHPAHKWPMVATSKGVGLLPRESDILVGEHRQVPRRRTVTTAFGSSLALDPPIPVSRMINEPLILAWLCNYCLWQVCSKKVFFFLSFHHRLFLFVLPVYEQDACTRCTCEICSSQVVARHFSGFSYEHFSALYRTYIFAPSCFLSSAPQQLSASTEHHHNTRLVQQRGTRVICQDGG
jgi:hypothetical protein